MSAGARDLASGGFLRCFVILALALVLTGCGSDTPPDIAKIVQELMGAAGLAAARAQAGAAARHYLEQRTKYLVGKNPGWGTEKAYPHLIARLSSEMGKVATFLTGRLTILGSTSDKSPAHRDLEDAAKRMTSDGPTAIAAQKREYVADREQRITQIVWRAGAVHPELWDGGDSTPAPTLKEDPLAELVDRRLHAVEMLMLHDEWKVGSWSVDTAAAGWRDGQRTSMFQYPWVQLGDGGFQAALTAKGIALSSLKPQWDFWPPTVTDELTFMPGQRMALAGAGDWVWDAPNYVMSLKPGITDVAAALGRIMPEAPKVDPSFEDFLNRSLVYCDIMLAVLHLEGLRFAHRRRTNSDSEFNTSAAMGVTLRPLIPEAGPPGPQWLMRDGAKWFDGTTITHDELQIGDHIVFWNNQYVRFILGSAFGLENSYVTRFTPDGSAVLAGHGMVEESEPFFALEMAGAMQDQYSLLIGGINANWTGAQPWINATAKKTKIKFLLVNWAPFGEAFKPSVENNLTKPGAWWIKLPLDILRDPVQPGQIQQPAPSLAQALAWIPKSIRVEPGMIKPTLPPGSFQADYQESVYLPLEQPQVHGGWPAYFAKHEAPGTEVVLDEIVPDGEMVPGFYKLGAMQKSQIPVLRPKVPS